MKRWFVVITLLQPGLKPLTAATPAYLNSCTDWCTYDNSDCVDGYKMVSDTQGGSRQTYCIFEGWRGIDTYLVTGGTTTYGYQNGNDCPAGTNIWVARSQSLLDKAFAKYGNAALFVGVYRTSNGCGGCTHYAMNSDTVQASHWTSVGGEPWFIRSTAYGEPNGDCAYRSELAPCFAVSTLLLALLWLTVCSDSRMSRHCWLLARIFQQRCKRLEVQ